MLQLKFSAWFGNLRPKNENKLVKIINAAGKVAGKAHTYFSIIFGIVVPCNTQLSIDSTHPFNCELALLRSVCLFTATLFSLTDTRSSK